MTPSYSLPLPPPPPKKLSPPGPRAKVQFVIEFVGSGVIPLDYAKALLVDPWRSALGSPAVWAKSPGSENWANLSPTQQGFDSIAVSWPMVSSAAQMSAAAAQKLSDLCQQFCGPLQRRAMPMPLPADLPQRASALLQIKQNADADVCFGVEFPGAPDSFSVMKWLTDSGLVMNPMGQFEWRDSSTSTSVFSVSPLEEDGFPVDPTNRMSPCTGISIDCWAPGCHCLMEALEASLVVQQNLAGAFSGNAIDEDGNPMTPSTIQELRTNCQLLYEVLAKVGLQPGSDESLLLFQG